MTDTDTEVEQTHAEEESTEGELRTWGLSGQPSTWALSTWTSLIDVIRAANRGTMDTDAVQQALDAVFPDAGYDARDVCLAHPPVGDFTAVADAETNSVRVDLAGDADLGLPDENVTWDFGDGSEQVHDAGGWDHAYAGSGEYRVRLSVMVAGASFGSDQVVTVGDAEPVEAPLDPGVAARDATVFESATDELPNNSVSPDAAEASTVEPDEPYDPGQHTVAEVLAYAADHPDEVDDIVAAEEAGQGRVTILDKLG